MDLSFLFNIPLSVLGVLGGVVHSKGGIHNPFNFAWGMDILDIENCLLYYNSCNLSYPD